MEREPTSKSKRGLPCAAAQDFPTSKLELPCAAAQDSPSSSVAAIAPAAISFAADDVCGLRRRHRRGINLVARPAKKFRRSDHFLLRLSISPLPQPGTCRWHFNLDASRPRSSISIKLVRLPKGHHRFRRRRFSITEAPPSVSFAFAGITTPLVASSTKAPVITVSTGSSTHGATFVQIERGRRRTNKCCILTPRRDNFSRRHSHHCFLRGRHGNL